MPIPDTKKCQHLIDLVAEEVPKLKAVATRLKGLRAAFLLHNPSTVGTPLDGHVGDVSTWINAVRAVADNAVTSGFVVAKSGRHRPPSALGEGL